MRKWEEKYKEIKSGKLYSRNMELQAKLTNKTITKEEYKELEKNKKIVENVTKIDNVLEYKNKLEKQLKEIKDEEARRKSIEDLKKQEKELESELKALEVVKARIERELKNKDITDTERSNLQSKLSTINDKMNKNQIDFSKNQFDFETVSKKQSKLSNIDIDSLKAKKISISSKISKCNMICGKLVEGYSWDSIDMKLEQWQDRKLTAKKGTADKLKQATEVEKGENGLEKDNSTEKNNSAQKDLVEVSEFDQKHPRLAKIKNFFKNIGKNIKEYFKEDKEDIKSDEKSVEEKNKNEKDDFRNYIKVVAEKGMKQADKDRLETKKKEVQQKIATSEGREPGDD